MKVKLKEKNYKLPNDWSEVKLRQFKNIILVDKEQEEFYFKTEILSELLKCELSDLREGTLDSLNSLWIKAEELLQSSFPETLPGTIILGNREFYFDSQLDKQSYGMFVDSANLRKQDDFWEIAEKVLAIYIRPVAKKKLDFSKWKGWNIKNYKTKAIELEPYDFDKQAEYSELLLDAPMSFIYPCALFFWNILSELRSNIHQSSIVRMNQMEMMNLMNKNQEEFTKNPNHHSMIYGGSIPPSIP